MTQYTSEYVDYAPNQRALQKQGVCSKAAAVQNKFVRKWAVWLGLATLLALFYVWARVQIVQLGYEITALRSELEGMSKQASMLEIEIAKMKAPERLEGFAKTRLGMRPPSVDQIIFVKPEEDYLRGRGVK